VNRTFKLSILIFLNYLISRNNISDLLLAPARAKEINMIRKNFTIKLRDISVIAVVADNTNCPKILQISFIL